jgi:predicted phage terminase large subunit-like protein
LPEGYFKQFVYTYNPWEESNYVVKKLTENLKPNAEVLEEKGKQEKIVCGKYEIEDNRYKGGKAIVDTQRLYMITNYKLNEFLSNQDRAVYEEMKVHEPIRYRTEGLGMPGVEPGNIFRDNMATFQNYYEDAPKLNWKCLSVDATFKKESKNKDKGKETDYVALQVWGISDDNQYYLTHRRKKHLSFLETCDEIDELVKLNPDLNAILIEDKANGSAIIEVMRKKYPFVIAVEPKGGKRSRAEAVAPCFETGAVHLPDRVWIEEYKAEFIAFPNGDHDDEVDCTSQALMRLMNITLTRLTNEQLKKRQQEEEEYDRLRNSVGINVDTETYIDAYSLW